VHTVAEFLTERRASFPVLVAIQKEERDVVGIVEDDLIRASAGLFG
jgi:hypothetical protein